MLAFIFCLTACGTSDSRREPRNIYVDAAHAYRVGIPRGWTSTAVRGMTQLSPETGDAHGAQQIVIRATEKPTRRDGPSSLHDGTQDETVVSELAATTESVLRGLPRAQLESRKTVESARLPGVEFSLTFVPRGMTRMYRRAHAMLVGSTHLYHVIYTSPADQPIDEDAFKTVVTTLNEGV
jgi:hypothetical protein